jgi:hypothetical protein
MVTPVVVTLETATPEITGPLEAGAVPVVVKVLSPEVVVPAESEVTTW